jgi:diguanylate cyclase (GGDEF)-like protein/PAS domain S-box-containing protein
VQLSERVGVARRALLVDSVVEGIFAIPVLITLRYFGWAGRAPAGVLVGCLIVAAVLGLEAVHHRVGGPGLQRHVHLRVATSVGATAAFLYVTGWGPMLAPAFAVLFSLHVKWGAPARVWRPMLGWSLAAVACGQAATAMGWLYSYVPGPQVHGLATLSALLLVMVLRVLGMTSEAHEREVARRELHIAARDRAERALQQNEQRFRALVHNSTDVIMITDVQGIPTYVSPSLKRITGHDSTSVEGVDRRSLVHAADHAAMDAARESVAADPGAESRVEIRILHADGTWHWHEVLLRNVFDEPAVAGIVVNFRDVTERRELEQQIRHQAFHDSLTGLANRALFMDRLEHALAAQHRSGVPLAVMLIDLDDFKSVNDSLGHFTGDQLIIEVAAGLRGATRPGDTVARLGGDEFAVLLADVPTHTQVTECANRVLAALKREFRAGEHRLPVTASIGVAVSTTATGTPEELLRNADVAMYVAKAQGKGCVELFKPGMHVAVQDRLQLKSDLAGALAAGDQLHLDYQPIVELATHRPLGVEALVRWRHPVRGVLHPDQFIPLAEESGLIVPLGRAVLTAACEQFADWRRRHPELGHLYLSVNVSPGQLDVGFVGDVKAPSEMPPLRHSRWSSRSRSRR